MQLLPLLCFLQAPLLPINNRALPPADDDFFFVALADDRPAGAGLPPTATFREILKEVSLIDPSFVICSGDLLYGNEDTLAQYRQEVAWLKPLLNAMPCPFFNTPGNHEISNKPGFLAEYKKWFGAPYGEFDFGHYRFLAVCTDLPSEPPGVWGDQLNWLTRMLGTPRPTVTFQHHPVFKRPTNADKEDTTVSNPDELSRLYADGGVKVAFEAHDHVYDEQEHGGVKYIIEGGAGAPLDAAPAEGGYFSYVLAHVTGEAIKLTPLPLDSIESVSISKGVTAVGNYSDSDIPIGNLLVRSANRPVGVSASYQTKKREQKRVSARIIQVRRLKGAYETRIGLIAPKHHAVFVRLIF